MLWYHGGAVHLKGLGNGDWANDKDDRRSTLRYVFQLKRRRNLVVYKKIMYCIHDDVKLYSLSSYSEKGCLVEEILYMPTCYDLCGWSRNRLRYGMFALAYTNDPKYHGRTTHVERRYRYIWDFIAERKIGPQAYSDTRRILDPLTKAIALGAFHSHLKSLGPCKIWLCLIC